MTMIDKIEDWFVHFGMPVVTCYHLIYSNVFLNTAAEDASGLEKMGNVILTPFQYIFAGQQAHVDENGVYDIRQHFDYHDHLILKSAGALVALPFSVVLGTALKGAAYCFSDVRARHERIQETIASRHVQSNLEYYRSIGIDLGDQAHPQKLIAQGYERRPEDLQHLGQEKQVFFEIVRLLKENQIPFWADCGTCLGAYRYGGIIPWDNDFDIAILVPDFSNVKRVLNALDSSKYLVEDWSNRLLPNTYMRVCVRATGEYIDLYNFAIFPEKKSMELILSNENSMFLTEAWKIRERRFVVATPFDVIFPLRLADFDGIEIPVPNQTERYLQMRYGENLAPSKIYNATSGLYEKDQAHPYWQNAHVH